MSTTYDFFGFLMACGQGKRTLQAMDWPEMLLQAMFESFPCANDKLYAKWCDIQEDNRCIISNSKDVLFHDDAIC